MSLQSLESMATNHVDPIALLYKGIAILSTVVALSFTLYGINGIGDECDKLKDIRYNSEIRSACARGDNWACATRIIHRYLK